jgi:hypothetical protein
MSRKNSGRFYKIIGGVNEGKLALAFNSDQTKETFDKKKMLVSVSVEKIQASMFDQDIKTEEKKVLVDFDKLKLVGYFD